MATIDWQKKKKEPQSTMATPTPTATIKQPIDNRQSNMQNPTPTATAPGQKPSTNPTWDMTDPNNIKWNVGGSTGSLNAAEYQKYLGNKEGTDTPNLQNFMRLHQQSNILQKPGSNEQKAAMLKQLAQTEHLKTYIADQRAKGRTLSEIADDIATGQLIGVGQEQTQAPIMNTQAGLDYKNLPYYVDSTGKKMLKQTGATGIINKGIYAMTSGEGTKEVLGTGAMIMTSVNSLLPSAFRLGAGRPESTKNIIDQFNKVNDNLNTDVQMVRDGTADFNRVNQDLRNGVDSVHALQEHLKGLGRLNVEYWADKGMALEYQLANELRELENKQVELEGAYAQQQAKQQVMQQQQQYGI